ncbi:MAG: N-acetyltransferase [Clostridiaceae bacterium]|jgi:GNAT superfamily N-acetyltransferase|nr:N-acetyltransferase [Clostridiaceae bacterium]
MITYKRCTDVSMVDTFKAFSIGFSDYIIKLKMSQDVFENRFFYVEGNSVEYSFVAFHDNDPVGVILGGIKKYEGIKTLRCDTFAISPDYRGTEISKKLFQLHQQTATENHCKQLFLEVIVGNDRAIKFYKKMGYDKIYDLSYFTADNLEVLNKYNLKKIDAKHIDINMFENSLENLQDVHINWQNHIDYIKKSHDAMLYGAFENDRLIAVLCINNLGKISHIWVEKSKRNMGTAAALINRACKGLNLSKLNIGFPNNNLLEGFLKNIGFKRDAIAQYEMYKTLF